MIDRNFAVKKIYYYMISGELCNSNPNCKYWTLREDELFTGCRLKTDFNIRSTVTGAFSGAKGCPSIKGND